MERQVSGTLGAPEISERIIYKHDPSWTQVKTSLNEDAVLRVSNVRQLVIIHDDVKK